MFNGKEYKDSTGKSHTAGVTAATKAAGASSFTPATLQLAADKNTYITVP